MAASVGEPVIASELEQEPESAQESEPVSEGKSEPVSEGVWVLELVVAPVLKWGPERVRSSAQEPGLWSREQLVLWSTVELGQHLVGTQAFLLASSYCAVPIPTVLP